MSTLKRNKAAYGVLFLNTKASFDEEGGRLVIEFPAENEFAFRAVQRTEVRDALAQALAQAVGGALEFCYVQRGAAPRPQPAPQPQPQRAPQPVPAPQPQPAPAPQPASAPQPEAVAASPDAWMADFAAGFGDVRFDEVRE